jgi:hypothetical protein
MLIENTKENYYETLKQSSQGWCEENNNLNPFVGTVKILSQNHLAIWFDYI